MNVRLSVISLPLLAALLTVTPVVAKGNAHPQRFTGPAGVSVALPMVCAEPGAADAVQVMIDIDSAFARKSASWTAPAVGRLVKFQCFNPIGRNEGAEWLLIPYGSSQAWIHYSMVRVKGDVKTLPITADVVTKTTLTSALPKGLPAMTGR
ncbi:MAG: hypothetical protein M1546_05590, partial [Chloroflexi bacterium]|nr:hypothetical protein [Chloroflexota bacterium]